jgi:hypothetical protein
MTDAGGELLSAAHHRDAHLSQGYATATALEQGRPDRMFEARQTPADSRVIDLEGMRGSRQAADAGDVQKDAQIIPIEAFDRGCHRSIFPLIFSPSPNFIPQMTQESIVDRVYNQGVPIR